jgi:hypothetical protein
LLGLSANAASLTPWPCPLDLLDLPGFFFFFLEISEEIKKKKLDLFFYNRKDLAFDSSPGYIGPN